MYSGLVVLVGQCDAFVVIILSGWPRRNQGRGLVDQKLIKKNPVILLLAVPRRIFGDFRCGVLLFMVILVIHSRELKMLHQKLEI